ACRQAAHRGAPLEPARAPSRRGRGLRPGLSRQLSGAADSTRLSRRLCRRQGCGAPCVSRLLEIRIGEPPSADSPSHQPRPSNAAAAVCQVGMAETIVDAAFSAGMSLKLPLLSLKISRVPGGSGEPSLDPLPPPRTLPAASRITAEYCAPCSVECQS